MSLPKKNIDDEEPICVIGMEQDPDDADTATRKTDGFPVTKKPSFSIRESSVQSEIPIETDPPAKQTITIRDSTSSIDVEVIDFDTPIAPSEPLVADSVYVAPIAKSYRSKYRQRKLRPRHIVYVVLSALILAMLLLLCMGYRIRFYAFADGTNATFWGRMKDGQAYVGTIYYHDGSTAKVDMRENGVVFENGDYYQGTFTDCRPNGEGSLYYMFGDTYHGHFANGLADGQGTLYFANGDTYQGAFSAGKPHGIGIYTWADGTCYKGTYKSGVRAGTGELYDAEGNLLYRGSFAENAEHGQGTRYFANGDVYTGAFLHGARTGYGIYTWKNGECYTGEFVDGLMHGVGTYTWPSGRTYTGTFYRGEPVT